LVIPSWNNRRGAAKRAGERLITKRQCRHNTFAHQIRFNFENSKRSVFF